MLLIVLDYFEPLDLGLGRSGRNAVGACNQAVLELLLLLFFFFDAFHCFPRKDSSALLAIKGARGRSAAVLGGGRWGVNGGFSAGGVDTGRNVFTPMPHFRDLF